MLARDCTQCRLVPGHVGDSRHDLTATVVSLTSRNPVGLVAANSRRSPFNRQLQLHPPTFGPPCSTHLSLHLPQGEGGLNLLHESDDDYDAVIWLEFTATAALAK